MIVNDNFRGEKYILGGEGTEERENRASMVQTDPTRFLLLVTQKCRILQFL